MSPLQKIAMGMVIVIWPANFPAHPSPAWNFYDALPDPIGWVLVLWGMHSLRRHLDVDVAWWLACVAFLVSLPLWFPQINHLLVPEYNDSVDASFQWFIALPTMGFSLTLARAIGQAGASQQPRDTFVAGRFGVVTWGLTASIVLPVIAYGGGIEALVKPTNVLIGLASVVLVFFLFRVHRREWLGGPGPLLIHPKDQTGKREGRPPSS